MINWQLNALTKLNLLLKAYFAPAIRYISIEFNYISRAELIMMLQKNTNNFTTLEFKTIKSPDNKIAYIQLL